MFSLLVKWYESTSVDKSLSRAQETRTFLAGSAKNQFYPAKYLQIIQGP